MQVHGLETEHSALDILSVRCSGTFKWECSACIWIRVWGYKVHRAGEGWVGSGWFVMKTQGASEIILWEEQRTKNGSLNCILTSIQMWTKETASWKSSRRTDEKGRGEPWKSTSVGSKGEDGFKEEWSHKSSADRRHEMARFNIEDLANADS